GVATMRQEPLVEARAPGRPGAPTRPQRPHSECVSRWSTMLHTTTHTAVRQRRPRAASDAHTLAIGVRQPMAINIEDLRQTARRRLPRALFDFVDGGGEDE